ncbi:MAG TPA: peptide deformylase [Terriglobales bacterium]|nr:peptide deformylase [Terriglobales bacterium]
MLLKIVQAGEEVLRRQARALTWEEILSEETQQLIEYMRETMHDAPGVGLAAPQVGLPIQLAVIEDREEYHAQVDPARLAERERRPVPFHVLINPKIVFTDSTSVEFFEGCLSVNGFSAIVPRARAVKVEYLDEKAQAQIIEASGWYARILQHEIDHLKGTLYIDRMHARTFMNVENLTRLWKDIPIGEVRTKLGV